jgi:hypothetical protein
MKCWASSWGEGEEWDIVDARDWEIGQWSL